MIPSLPAMMEEGLRNQKDDWGDDRLHVSDLSVYLEDGKCPRELWLRLNGYEKRELTAGQMLMFSNAHGIHERIVNILEIPLLNAGWKIWKIEEPVSVNGVKGRADMVIKHEEGMEVVVDFKTLRGRAFQYLEQPKESHVLQVQAYMMGEGASKGVVFYLDREGSNASRQFVLDRDDEKVSEAVNCAKNVGKILHSPEKLPPKVEIRQNKGPDSVYLKLPWQCDYCQYRDVSCEGALPQQYRDLGVVGKTDGTNFKNKGLIPGEYVDLIINNLKEAV